MRLLRQFIYQEIESSPEFASAGLVTEKFGKDCISIMALTTAQRARRREAKRVALNEGLALALGARAVFTAMVEACGGSLEGGDAAGGASGRRGGVPLVGHNCLADLCFLLSAFDADLPTSYVGFKERVHALFPTVIDTKLVVAVGAARDWWAQGSSSLEALVETFDSEPPSSLLLPEVGARVEGDFAGWGTWYPGNISAVNAAEGTVSVAYDDGDTEEGLSLCRTRPLGPMARIPIIEVSAEGPVQPVAGGAKYHEAGWDAFCTGRVLVRLAEEAQRFHARASAAKDQDKMGDIDLPADPAGNEAAAPGSEGELGVEAAPWALLPCNRLNLMRSPYVMHLDVEADGPAPGDRAATEVARRDRAADDLRARVAEGEEEAEEEGGPGSGGGAAALVVAAAMAAGMPDGGDSSEWLVNLLGLGARIGARAALVTAAAESAEAEAEAAAASRGRKRRALDIISNATQGS